MKVYKSLTKPVQYMIYDEKKNEVIEEIDEKTLQSVKEWLTENGMQIIKDVNLKSNAEIMSLIDANYPGGARTFLKLCKKNS